MTNLNRKAAAPAGKLNQIRAAIQEVTDDDIRWEAAEKADWRRLPPTLAALLKGDSAAAEAIVGESSASMARRCLVELEKQQQLIDKALRKKQVQKRTLRAGRAIAARKLNGWDQEEAARRLGYANSTQLSLLESGSREINLDHVERFSEVYRVSTDFLLGRASSEVELDARRLASDRVIQELHQIAEALMQRADASNQCTGGVTAETVRGLVEHTRAVSSAMARVDGPALDAVKGGSTLAFAVEQLEEVAMEAARAVAGYEGEVQRLRDLLRTPPANDPSASGKSGSAHSA